MEGFTLRHFQLTQDGTVFIVGAFLILLAISHMSFRSFTCTSQRSFTCTLRNKGQFSCDRCAKCSSNASFYVDPLFLFKNLVSLLLLFKKLKRTYLPHICRAVYHAKRDPQRITTPLTTFRI